MGKEKQPLSYTIERIVTSSLSIFKKRISTLLLSSLLFFYAVDIFFRRICTNKVGTGKFGTEIEMIIPQRDPKTYREIHMFSLIPLLVAGEHKYYANLKLTAIRIRA